MRDSVTTGADSFLRIGMHGYDSEGAHASLTVGSRHGRMSLLQSLQCFVLLPNHSFLTH
jgi:hypothetical protein